MISQMRTSFPFGWAGPGRAGLCVSNPFRFGISSWAYGALLGSRRQLTQQQQQQQLDFAPSSQAALCQMACWACWACCVQSWLTHTHAHSYTHTQVYIYFFILCRSAALVARYVDWILCRPLVEWRESSPHTHTERHSHADSRTRSLARWRTLLRHSRCK